MRPGCTPTSGRRAATSPHAAWRGAGDSLPLSARLETKEASPRIVRQRPRPPRGLGARGRLTEPGGSWACRRSLPQRHATLVDRRRNTRPADLRLLHIAVEPIIRVRASAAERSGGHACAGRRADHMRGSVPEQSCQDLSIDAVRLLLRHGGARRRAPCAEISRGPVDCLFMRDRLQVRPPSAADPSQPRTTASVLGQAG
jgi:hypothetical protein